TCHPHRATPRVSTISFAARGQYATLDAAATRALFDRTTSRNGDVRAETAAILREVESRGDAALHEYAERFDGVSPNARAALEVPRTLWREALASLDPALRGALERAATNIRIVHEAFRPEAREMT